MADIISNIVEDKQEIKNQLGTIPDIMKIPKRFDSRIALREIATKYTVKNVSGSMIWGSESYGVWGTSEWGSTSGTAFILNSTTFGKLGVAKLGSSGISEALYAVIPNNNKFTEHFGQTLFIDTINSTGTIDTSLETYTLDAGEVLQSEVIAKLRAPITKIQFLQYGNIDDETQGLVLPFKLGVDTFGDDNAQVQVSNDGGATWENIQNIANVHTFSTSSVDDELKYRVTATQTLVIDEPLIIKIN